MKRLLAIMLALTCLAISSVAFADIKIDNLSREELSELRNRIDARIKEIDDTQEHLYEDKDVTVDWLGLEQDMFGYVKPSLKIFNKSNKSVYCAVPTLVLNGIKVSLMNSFGTEEIEPGLTLITSSFNDYILVGFDDYESVGLNSLEDVETVYFELKFYKNSSGEGKAIKTIKETINMK